MDTKITKTYIHSAPKSTLMGFVLVCMYVYVRIYVDAHIIHYLSFPVSNYVTFM
jgi:hypothetical protein